VVWIGYLQWRYEDEGGVLHYFKPRKMEHPRQLPTPILKDKNSPDESDRIVCDDAIMRYRETLTPRPPLPQSEGEQEPYEPNWPEVDVIIGNPPFLGGKRIRAEIGDDYIDALFTLYEERVPHEADLVCYWYEKARAQVEQGKAKRVGLLATNSIRGGANRIVLEHIKQTGDIFYAWGDRKWVLAGANVRISIIGFDDGTQKEYLLDGAPVNHINADLQNTIDATKAVDLKENTGIAFMGVTPAGPFDVKGNVARQMLDSKNKSGRDNADVVRPYYNAIDIVRRARDMWIIDFGTELTEAEASQYKRPFEYVKNKVLPERLKSRQPEREKEKWWIFTRSRPEMRNALKPLHRYIGTPMVSKHRLYVWLEPIIVPANLINVIARSDDYFFGVLHSYLHEIWALRLGTSLEDRPRYTPTTTFETFPFSWPPGKEDTTSPHYVAISAAAQQLHEERDHWLNPSPEEHIVLGITEKTLKERTLTNLYNALVEFRSSETPHQPEPHPLAPSPFTERGSKAKNGNGNGNGRIPKAARDFAPRLAELHDALDRAVLAAYGWDDLMASEGHVNAVSLRTAEGDEELLRRLLALNLQRAGYLHPD
jgi:hypothetical protein